MLNELSQNITNSKWDQVNKQKLISFLPFLKDSFINYLYNESGKLGFEFTQESLCEVVELCVQAEKDILVNKFDVAINILNIAPSYAWWQSGDHVLPWALDLQDKVRTDKKFQNPELQKALVKFFLSMFKDLPISNVDLILQNFIFFTLYDVKADLFLLIKKYVYFKHWNNEPELTKPLSESMVHNNEICSEDLVIFENKKVQVTLDIILKDFISSSGTKISERGAYDITKYFISSKIIKSIKDEKKDVVLEYLKIFLWLQKPVINSDDLSFLNYKYLALKEDFDINDYFKFHQATVDSLGNNLNYNNSDRIEQKLAELRKKVNI
jgi:hypothetical protein